MEDIDSVSRIMEVNMPIALVKNGNVSFCYKLTKGIDLLNALPERYEEVGQIWDKGFELLGEGFVIQQQDVYLEREYDGNFIQGEGFLNDSVRKYYDGKKYLEKSIYIYITKIYKNALKQGYVYNKASVKGDIDINITQERVNSFLAYMNGEGIRLEPMKDDEEFYSLTLNYLSCFKDDAFHNIKFKDDSILIGESTHLGIAAITSAECLPVEVPYYSENTDYSAVLYNDFGYNFGYGFNCSHVVNYVLFIDNQNAIKDKLEESARTAKALALMDAKNIQRAQDNMDFIQATHAGRGKLICRMHANVVYWADSLEEYKRLRSDLTARFKRKNIKPHFSDKTVQRYWFFCFQPASASTLPADETFFQHSNVYSALISKDTIEAQISSVETDKRGLMVTHRLLDIPVYRDSWFIPYSNKQIQARNSCKIGKTGGGKTVSVINDLYQYWQMGFYVSCIDNGNSLEVITKLVGGNYIVYKEGMKLGINPFNLNGVLSAEKLEFLVTFCYMLWKPGYVLNKTEEGAFSELILKAYGANKLADEHEYKVSNKLDFRSFYEWVLNNKDLVKKITKREEFFDSENFLMATRKFYDGIYSQLFLEGKRDYLDINNRWTVWEMSNVVDHQTLFPIFAMLITDLTMDVMLNRKDLNKIFWFEEAGKVVEKAGMASFFIYLLRTIRKYDGQFGVSIQEINNMDVPGTQLLRTFLSNTDVWDICFHNDAEATNLAKALEWITPDKKVDIRYSLLRSLKNDVKAKFPYMERLNIIGSDAKIVKSMLTPVQIASFMSDRSDKEKLFKAVEEVGGDLEKGILKYANEK